MQHCTYLTALDLLAQKEEQYKGDLAKSEALAQARYKLDHTKTLNFEAGVAAEIQEAIDLLDGLDA